MVIIDVVRQGSTPVNLCAVLPIKTVSEANSHQHWRVRQKRAKAHREAMIVLSLGDLPPLPVVVTLTRLSPRALDSDNLPTATKHIRDGIADRYGVKDNDPRIQWCYAQEKAKEFGVRIGIQTA